MDKNDILKGTIYTDYDRRPLDEFGFDIINRIGYFRTKANLSQKALSIGIDMNVGYINRLECKKDFLPSLEVLNKIIVACGITPEYFFYSDIPNYEEDKEILKKLKDLPHDKREALLKLL